MKHWLYNVVMSLAIAAFSGVARAETATLTTVRPGPHSLVLHGALDTARNITVSAGNISSVIDVPEGCSSTPIEQIEGPVIVRLESSDGLPLPRAQLLAKGDPLKAAWLADTVLQETLPSLEADSVLVSLVTSGAMPSGLSASGTIGERPFSITLPPGAISARSEPITDLPVGDTWTLTLATPGDTASHVSTVEVTPLFKKLQCLAAESGVYLYNAYDTEGRDSGTAAFRLKAGKASEKLSEGTLVGSCRNFIPAGEVVVSSLESDGFFEFDGFSHREKTAKGYQRWTSGETAIVKMPAPSRAKCRVAIRVSSSCPESVIPSNATISIGDQEFPLNLSGGSDSVEATVTAPNSPAQGLLIQLRSRTWKPADFPPSRDSRTLGILLEHLEIEYLD